MKICTRETAREIDRRTIEEFGVPGVVLMENAGRAVARVVIERYPGADGIAVVCGGGNNGGDGFVAARHLLAAGKKVSAHLAQAKDRYSGDAKTNLDALLKMSADVRELGNRLPRAEDADVIVDAVFGTGLARDVGGFYEKLVGFMNDSEKPVVSVDVPSGLDADSGRPMGVAVRADATVTFAHAKLGTCVHPGVEHAGELYVADITTPKALERDLPHELLTFRQCAGLVRKREADSHKGTHGHLLALAGSPGKSGAAVLCALGAIRAGSGLVTLGVPRSIAGAIEEKTTEAMSVSLADSGDGTFSPEAREEAVGLLREKKTALAMGPGVSTSAPASEFVAAVARECEVPLVLDADALNIAAKRPEIFRETKAPVVITPHPGEMARLLGTDVKSVQTDRVGAASGFARRRGCHVVLKGARTVIASPDGEISVNPTGNPAMATGGTGDVLTGVIGGLLAQGYSPRDACRLGVFLHGHAADLLLGETGAAGFTATDISDKIPASASSVLSATEERHFRTIG